MIALDTNVLIRYLTQDDKEQSAKANKLFEQKLSIKSPGFISLIVLLEVSWVLMSCYKQDKQALIKIIAHLLSTKQLIVEHSEVAYKALNSYMASNGDFSDALIYQVSCHHQCSKMVTFDKKAVNLGMTLL